MASFHFTSVHGSWLHPLLVFTIVLVAVFPICSVAQNISINDSVTAAETSRPWRSPNGDFAFGFQQLQSNSDHFVLSIWLDKIPDKTLVWYERSSYPVPRGSMLQLEARDGLVLRNPQGSPLYNTSILADDEVAQGSIQDTGNLILTGPNSSNILWDSFTHPADTLLPTQTIDIDQMLISRKTEADFSQGRFYARMINSGNFVLSTKTAPLSEIFDAEYYSSTTSDNNNSSNSGFRVEFKETSFSISVVTNDSRSLKTLIDPAIKGAQNYYRATLDFDGVFRLYYHPKTFEGNPQWTRVQGLPTDANSICRITGKMGSGACGYNSFCIVQNGRPVCQCPQGFSLADPNNTQGDCKSDFVQNCVQGEDEECELEVINDVKWPEHDYERLDPTTEQQCRDACLNDYFCTAAVFGGVSCWKKNFPLSNGRGNDSPPTRVFLKRGKPANQQNVHQEKSKRDQKVLIVVISLILGSSVLVNLFFTGAAFFGFFSARNITRDTTAGSNIRCFTYKELVQATGGFKDELGRGSFGIVYNGVMPDDSRTLVAVKKLDRVAQDSEKEFRTEVNVIGQIHHKNVVRLLGFCDEGPNRLLVYERMTNGTLASFLHGDQKPSWSQRTQIALGVARGLAYLHEECITQIIHCDIKPQNILLDDNYTARISDFGLAKLLMLNQSRTTTNIRGTKGYVSPEWFRNTQITTKVDVYSFGVVLLEIISCRKAVVDVEFESGENPIMTEWAWECYLEGRLDSLVKNEEEACSDAKMLERFVKVGFWCIQEDAALRPTIRKACQMLEGTIDVAPPPCPFSYTFISVQN
ncbi:hypothetical protein C2S51_025185 [Perilla frutescens var. frutescens]|nr:hypothetical protein C2S51_025185 [Perilla frutescens var. frutescens]